MRSSRKEFLKGTAWMGVVAIAVCGSSAWGFDAAEVKVCRTDTGVCSIPAGERNGTGSPISTSLADVVGRKHRVVRQDAWYGGRRTVFDFEGYEAWVVEPPEGVAVAAGKPWTWTMQWKTAFVPRTGVPTLLKQGWHHVTIDTYERRMDEEGLRVSAAFQKYLVDELGLAKKSNLIGMSWGGFFSTRYAANYPQNVAKIFLDCPLLNLGCRFKANIGIGPWEKKSPENWIDDPRMPINLVKPIADAKIPVLLVYGGADDVLNPKLSSEIFIPRFKAAGGRHRGNLSGFVWASSPRIRSRRRNCRSVFSEIEYAKTWRLSCRSHPTCAKIRKRV